MSAATAPAEVAGAPPRATFSEGLRYLAVSVCLFGGIWPITKDALSDATPLWFALTRAGLACLVAGALMAAFGRLRLPAAGDRAAIVAIGLLQIGGFFALTHAALAFIPAGRTAILSNITVFWLIPLSLVFLGERVSRRQWLAVGIGLGGVALLMRPWDIRGQGAGALAGYGLLLLASLLWSLAILVTRRWPPRRPVPELLPWCFLLASLLLLPLALLREPAGGVGWSSWPHALFIGAVAAPIGTWSTVEAGRRLSGVMASVGFLLVPALGLAIATLWLGEPLGWDVLAGGGLIAASVVLAARG